MYHRQCYALQSLTLKKNIEKIQWLTPNISIIIQDLQEKGKIRGNQLKQNGTHLLQITSNSHTAVEKHSEPSSHETVNAGGMININGLGPYWEEKENGTANNITITLAIIDSNN